MWRADLPNEAGAYNRVVQDGESVYVLAQGRALAFDVARGTRLWATNEFTSGALFRVVGGAALTRNRGFNLEWRDAQSGEVIAPWGKRDHGVATNAVVVGNVILLETHDSVEGDGLSLLRLPGTIAQRLTPR